MDAASTSIPPWAIAMVLASVGAVAVVGLALLVSSKWDDWFGDDDD